MRSFSNKYPVAFGKTDVYDPEQYKEIERAFEVLNIFLEGQEYVAGRYLTIADLAVAATVSTAEVKMTWIRDVENYFRGLSWCNNCRFSVSRLKRTRTSLSGWRK